MNNETKKCQYCGEEIMFTAKKCKFCGEWLDKFAEELPHLEFCHCCDKEVSSNAEICVHCGVRLDGRRPPLASSQKDLPIQLRRYNWGAFWGGFIWGVFNGMPKHILGTMIGLFIVSLIPFIGILPAFCLFGLNIWSGTKGNVWAWNYKKYESIEIFNDYQQKWAVVSSVYVWSIVLTLLYIFLIFCAICDGTF